MTTHSLAEHHAMTEREIAIDELRARLGLLDDAILQLQRDALAIREEILELEDGKVTG